MTIFLCFVFCRCIAFGFGQELLSGPYILKVSPSPPPQVGGLALPVLLHFWAMATPCDPAHDDSGQQVTENKPVPMNAFERLKTPKEEL